MSYRKRISWGLRGRATAHCAVILLTASGLIVGRLLWQQYRHSIAVFRQHEINTSLSLARAMEPDLLLNDIAGLERHLRLLDSDPEVIQVEVYSAHWHPLATYSRDADRQAELRLVPDHSASETAFRVELAETATPASPELYTTPQGEQHPSTKIYNSTSQMLVVTDVNRPSPGIDLELLDESIPTTLPYESALGHVVVHYSLSGIRAETMGALWSGIQITGAVLMLAVLLTAIVVGHALRPLRHLVNVTRSIAGGDHSVRASEHAIGEIGQLARSFNHMAKNVQRSHEDIEAIVEQRTAELIRANQAKDDFLANMSHEIRTPMTAILGFADTLAEPGLTDEERQVATSTIRRNGAHLMQIISDILDLSKIQAGQLSVELLSCAPRSIVEEVASMMRVRAQERGLTFAVEYEGLVPATIRTDPTRLRQVLLNLVGNALKFTRSGTVRLRVELVPPNLCFEVIDTGIGMTPEQLTNVFKPFTQADETTTRRFGGTGLGLTICDNLARFLGGTITASSELGVGSRFKVTIDPGPLDGVALIDPYSVTAEPLEPEGSPPESVDLTGVRVLLAEDGPDNQRLISTILRKAGAIVEFAADGQEALAAVSAAEERGQSFAVILMDMQMPVMDGYTASRTLRARGYAGPIIALTAHAMAHDRAKCIEAGCEDYAAKPISRQRLLEIVALHACCSATKKVTKPVPASAAR